MMFRYLVFVFDSYDQVGGMNGCKLKTNDSREVAEFINEFNNDFDYIEVYDTVADIVYDVIDGILEEAE